MDNNGFLNKMKNNAISREEGTSRTESLEHQQKYRQAVDIANKDYLSLKEEVINFASTKGYIEKDNRKIVEYFFSPDYTVSEYRFDNGLVSRVTAFGKLKVTQTGIYRYTPKDEMLWNYYISEIVKLGKEDGISINAVFYSSREESYITFPVYTKDYRFMSPLLRSVHLRCYYEFQ